MADISPEQAKIQVDILDFFAGHFILRCKTQASNGLVVLEFLNVKPGFFVDSKKSAFTVYFQKGADILTKKESWHAGIVMFDRLTFGQYLPNLMSIISRHYPGIEVKSASDIPAGAY